MLTEILIATIATFCLYAGWKAVTGYDGKILRLLAGLFIILMAVAEILTAVDLAVTATSDVGEVRKVGALAILAAIIALWHAPKWLLPRTEEA